MNRFIIFGTRIFLAACGRRAPSTPSEIWVAYAEAVDANALEAVDKLGPQPGAGGE